MSAMTKSNVSGEQLVVEVASLRTGKLAPNSRCCRSCRSCRKCRTCRTCRSCRSCRGGGCR